MIPSVANLLRALFDVGQVGPGLRRALKVVALNHAIQFTDVKI